jgi:hypothetical protein
MPRAATTLLTLVTVLVASTLFAQPAGAALRSPQVAVQGGTLQGYLNSVGEQVNVLTDQNAIQLFRNTVATNSTFTLLITLETGSAGNAVGVYDPNALEPTLIPILPAEATAEWFASVTFRTSPAQVTVSLFDASANFHGTHTYAGGNRNAFAFYLQAPGGTFYMQDARNPGGDPQALAFAATGVNTGSWWLCWEDTPLGSGSDRDFDDSVIFLETSTCLTDCTEVLRTTWGQVKAHYR